MPTDKEFSIANGDAFRKRIVVLGTGPVALFTAYCLNQNPLNEVIILGRPDSDSIDKLINSGRLMLNTKTIRDNYAMIFETYTPTENDPDISVQYPDAPEGRAIQNGALLVNKFLKMEGFGQLAANAIRQRGNGPLTREDLNEFTEEHFETPVEAFDPQKGLTQRFDTEANAKKPIYATNDASLIGASADLVITALKAHSLDQALAEKVSGLLLPNAPALIAANGINTTLLPPGNDRASRPLRNALMEIPALSNSAAFTSYLEEKGHATLGASITFALQLGTDMEKSVVNHNPQPGDMIFSSKVHEAYLTIPENPVVKEAFEATPLTVYRETGTDYTKEVLTKLAKNLMNIMCAGLSKTKIQIVNNERFKAAYADAVGELFDVALAYGIQLANSRSTFIKRSIDYHIESAQDGGHKSSTVVDIEKGRKTEAPFLIESLEQLADKASVNIHMLRILRRSIRSAEEQNTPEEAIKRGKQLARNIVRLPDGSATQFRKTNHKAAVGNSEENQEAGHGRQSGTYFDLIPAWSYRHGMKADTALFLITRRIEIDTENQSQNAGFYKELLETFYDPKEETGFIEEFEPLEELLIEKIPGFAHFIDDFVMNRDVRRVESSLGGGGGDFVSDQKGTAAEITLASANDLGINDNIDWDSPFPQWGRGGPAI